MRLWFSPSSEVPIYRQLVTQVELAVLSGDLRPGVKLPSTRELARRFALHPNTVSAGYRKLVADGWVERRHGSGIYVRGIPTGGTTPYQELDRHIQGFFKKLRELNAPPAEIRERVARWLAAPPPDHLLLIDPDEELRKIILSEIRRVTTYPVMGVSLEECADPGKLLGAIPICRPSKTLMVRAALPSGIELTTLRIRSAQEWLAPWLPPPEGHLIAVASQWPDFLTIARTMLVAAHVPQESLIYRDARKPRWTRGLEQVTAILCDSHTASLPSFPRTAYKVVFPLLADVEQQELARYSEDGPISL